MWDSPLYLLTFNYIVIIDKGVVWLGDILWISSMEFSSHRNFIAPNISATEMFGTIKFPWLENSIELIPIAIITCRHGICDLK